MTRLVVAAWLSLLVSTSALTIQRKNPLSKEDRITEQKARIAGLTYVLNFNGCSSSSPIYGPFDGSEATWCNRGYSMTGSPRYTDWDKVVTYLTNDANLMYFKDQMEVNSASSSFFTITIADGYEATLTMLTAPDQGWTRWGAGSPSTLRARGSDMIDMLATWTQKVDATGAPIDVKTSCPDGYSGFNGCAAWHVYQRTIQGPSTYTVVHEKAFASNGAWGTPTFVHVDPAGTAGASANGDPHLQNVKGEAFDIMQTGNMMLLEIPRGSTPETLDLAMHADIDNLGVVQCGPTFITNAYMTGRWLGTSLDIHSGRITKKGANTARSFGIRLGKTFESHADFEARTGGEMKLSEDTTIKTKTRKFIMKIGGLDIVVSQPIRPRLFLDIQVKGLGKLKTEVGGLLGTDDHSAVEELPSECKSSPRLKVKTGLIQETLGSATASL